MKSETNGGARREMKMAVLVLGAAASLACSKANSAQSDAGEGSPAEGPREQALKVLATFREADTLRWTPDLQRRRSRARELAGCGERRGDCEKDTEEWCPEVKPLRVEKTSDEFARKDRDRRFDAARIACITKLRAELGPDPKLAVLAIALKPPREYDFKEQRFLLHAGTGWPTYHAAVWAPPSTWGFGEASYKIAKCEPAPEPFGFLALTRMTGEFLTGPLGPMKAGSPVAVVLKTPEAKAPQMKARLVRDGLMSKDAGAELDYAPASPPPPTLLRLEILFEPGDYGDTPVMCNRPVGGGETVPLAMKGFVGRGVGYRVVDVDGVLLDWQPLGG